MSVIGGISALSLTQSLSSLLPALYTGDPSAQWMEPFRRGNLADANKQVPNLPASFSEILSVYYTGGCQWAEAHRALKYLGILTRENPDELKIGGFWSQVADIRQPRVPLDMAIRQDILGVRVRESLEHTIRRYGYRYVTDREAIKTDSHPLSVDMCLALWRAGLMRDADLEKYLRHAGYRNTQILEWLKKYQSMPGIGDAVRAYWAGVYTTEDIRKVAKFGGYVGEKEIGTLIESVFNWPGVGEVLNLSLSQSFDDQYSARWQLDNEKPPQLEYFLRKTGQSWSPLDQQPNGWIAPGHTMGDFYWRSHWTPIPPDLAIEMFRRLRSTGGPDNGPRVPGIRPFTLEQLTDVFQRTGVMPGIREQLRAVSYKIPQRLLVKRLYAENIIDLAEVTEMMQDQGFNKDSASRLATLVHKETVSSRIDKVRPITVSQVKEAYRIGVISRDVAKQNMYIASLTDPDQIRTQISLPIGTYSDGGLLEPFIEAGLRAIDTDIAAELSKQGIEVWHKAYLRGEIDANNARDSLIRMGIIFDRATQYVQLWTYELAAEGVELSAAKLVDYYISHLIDQNTLFSRLIGLHYTPHDAQLIIASANLKLSEAAAKLQEKIGKAQEQQHKQLAAAAQQLQKQQAALSKQLCRSSSKSQLVSWATKRIIDYPSAFDRLTQCGMTPDDALNAFAAAADKKGGLTRDEIKEKIGPAFSSTEGNGQATTTDEQPGT